MRGFLDGCSEFVICGNPLLAKVIMKWRLLTISRVWLMRIHLHGVRFGQQLFRELQALYSARLGSEKSQ